MGHIVGLAHEQQYCGRNNFLSVSNPQPSDLIYRYHFLELCGASDSRNYNVFDFRSIMLYAVGPYESQNLDPRTNFRYTVTMDKVTPPKAHYCGDPNTFGSNYSTSPIKTLSAGDIAAINEMYGRSSSTPSSVCSVTVIYNSAAFTSNTATVKPRNQLRLQAQVNGYRLSNTNTVWTVTPNLGTYTISAIAGNPVSTLNYTVPWVSAPTAVTLKATSAQDTSKSSSLQLTILPDPTFDPNVYRRLYADLRSLSDTAAYNHYQSNGINEIRRASLGCVDISAQPDEG
jgi:hypothetical protein